MTVAILSYPEFLREGVVRRRMQDAAREPLWGLGTWAAFDAQEHVKREQRLEAARESR